MHPQLEAAEGSFAGMLGQPIGRLVSRGRGGWGPKIVCSHEESCRSAGSRIKGEKSATEEVKSGLGKLYKLGRWAFTPYCWRTPEVRGWTLHSSTEALSCGPRGLFFFTCSSASDSERRQTRADLRGSLSPWPQPRDSPPGLFGEGSQSRGHQNTVWISAEGFSEPSQGSKTPQNLPGQSVEEAAGPPCHSPYSCSLRSSLQHAAPEAPPARSSPWWWEQAE